MKPTTQPRARRHYYIKRGSFANMYSLRWTDSAAGDATAHRLGYERITRAEAIRQARAERERQQYDPSFSGYADARVFPLYPLEVEGYMDEIGSATAAPGNSIIAERV